MRRGPIGALGALTAGLHGSACSWVDADAAETQAKRLSSSLPLSCPSLLTRRVHNDEEIEELLGLFRQQEVAKLTAEANTVK